MIGALDKAKPVNTINLPVHLGGSAIRIVARRGEPWFVAKDACEALGLPGFASYHTDRLSPKDKITLRKGDAETTRSRFSASLFSKSVQSVTLISEAGFYQLVFRSEKPEAKAFRKWVTGTVIPTIRKTGSYIQGEEKLDDPDLTQDDLNKLNDRIIALERYKVDILKRKLTQAQERLDVAEPKAAIVDVHVADRNWDSSEGGTTIGAASLNSPEPP